MTREEQIKEVIENFDFDKCHKVMEHLNWSWYDSDETPMVGKLVLEATRLLKDAIKNYETHRDVCSVATGGLKATAYEDHLTLEFILTYWTTG